MRKLRPSERESRYRCKETGETQHTDGDKQIKTALGWVWRVQEEKIGRASCRERV